MAGHDDGDAIAPERLPDFTRGAGFADPRGDLAIGERLPRRDGARHRINLPVEGGHAFEIKRNGFEIGPDAIGSRARNERDDGIDRRRNGGRGRCFACIRPTPDEPRARALTVGLGELQGDNTGRAPGDATSSDGGVEKRKLRGHGATCPKRRPSRLIREVISPAAARNPITVAKIRSGDSR
jgi:hypothetical protein